jgi:Protein of unknown function (DUF3040)
VSLPGHQQRVLDRIEGDLRGCEPRLVSMFAIFTRLTRDEGAPPAEPQRSGNRRRTRPGRELIAAVGAIIVVPFVLGLAALFVFLAVSSGAAHGCKLGTVPHPVVTIRILTCRPAQEPPGHGT